MDKTRLWIIGSALAMVAIAALGWVLGIQPQLDAATAADGQTAQVDGQNTANSTVLARLKKDSEGLPELKDQLAQLEASIPSTQQAPAFADELRAAHPRGTVLIAGHSDTVPDIVAALCACDVAPMPDHEYDRLSIVHVDAAGRARLDVQRYGAASPTP